MQHTSTGGGVGGSKQGRCCRVSLLWLAVGGGGRCNGCRAKAKLSRVLEATDVQLVKTEHCTCHDRCVRLAGRPS